MCTFEINKRKIGDGCPVYVIAEGCDNHMGNMGDAKEMCRQALNMRIFNKYY